MATAFTPKNVTSCALDRMKDGDLLRSIFQDLTPTEQYTESAETAQFMLWMIKIHFGEPVKSSLGYVHLDMPSAKSSTKI